jgi:hypothetical protein
MDFRWRCGSAGDAISTDSGFSTKQSPDKTTGYLEPVRILKASCVGASPAKLNGIFLAAAIPQS